jgi:hypothetical protein
MLKLRRRKKGDLDHQRQLQQTEAQGKAQAEATGAAKMAEIETTKATLESQMKLESVKTEGKAQLLQQEAAIKERLMAQEFQYNMQLKQTEAAAQKLKSDSIEDRKDQRTKIQATQQSELLDQKTNEKPPKNFESKFDSLGPFQMID